MRDRLIELINRAKQLYKEDMAFDTIDGAKMPTETDYIIDYLLANSVIVPPCKVGDKVYSIIYHKKNVFSHFLIETYVGIHLSNATDLRGHRRKNYIIVWNENTNSIRHIDIKKIGKTVFLTKEEAEKHLKGGVQE